MSNINHAPIRPLQLLLAAAALSVSAISCSAEAPSSELEKLAPSANIAHKPVLQAAPGGRARPNILFILLDDAGYHDLGGRELIRPNIDRLMAEGLRYDNFYTAPMCSPTRTSALTAKYPARYGLQWVYGGKTVRGIEKSEHTLIDAFNQSGYTTAHFGKWHAGQGEDYEVFDFGYDYAMNAGGVVQNGYHDPTITYADGSSKRFAGGHTTDVVTDHVIEFLERQAASTAPFMLNIWYHAPHGPHQPADRWLDRYSGADKHRNYKALFSQADENIGRILDYLDSVPGLYENTIVMLASDNGGTRRARDHNGGLRGYKTDVFEGGIKSPLIVRWPDRVIPGRSDKVVAVMDLPPTMLELVGIKDLNDRDGRSFASHVISATAGFDWVRDRPLFWLHKVRGDLKNARKFRPEFAQHSWAVRDGDWKLVYEPLDADKPMLFKVKNDPGEADDLAAVDPDRVQILYDKYLSWKQNVSELQMTVAAMEGAVEKTGSGFDFPATGHMQGSRVVYNSEQLHNIYDQDFTFTAIVETYTAADKSRVIAAKPGAWVFRIDADGHLELQLIGRKGGRGVIRTNFAIQQGRRYDIAFSVVGMKKLSNYARIFVREEGGAAYRLVGQGVGVRAVKGTSSPIMLGSNSSGGEQMEGSIIKPRFFLAPFNTEELSNI